MTNQVEAYYDAQAAQEWNRLERHPTEFALNMRLLREYLPTAPATVLDSGGGPGRYAIALAKMGHEVTLFDLSEACLRFAAGKAAEEGVALKGAVHGDARDLSHFADASFDAVLLMGPMYHLLTEADRLQSLREAHRVLKPGGTLGVAFIGRYACVVAQTPAWVAANLEMVKRELATGIRDRADGQFPGAYGTHPSEVGPLLASSGFTFVEMIASEGVHFGAEAAASQLEGDLWEAWVEVNYPLAKDPSIHGAAVHLFAVARKA